MVIGELSLPETTSSETGRLLLILIIFLRHCSPVRWVLDTADTSFATPSQRVFRSYECLFPLSPVSTFIFSSYNFRSSVTSSSVKFRFRVRFKIVGSKSGRPSCSSSRHLSQSLSPAGDSTSTCSVKTSSEVLRVKLLRYSRVCSSLTRRPVK